MGFWFLGIQLKDSLPTFGNVIIIIITIIIIIIIIIGDDDDDDDISK